ncbi:TPA: MerR family transcriptional regulator [Legionella pneumophila]|nr:MerR family transcriptional regulator [Legionella pneumophila]
MDKVNSNGFNRIMYDDLFLSGVGQYLKTKKKGSGIVTFLTEKKFTIKNIDSSYRIINHWSKLGLFDDSRTDNKGWRKFNLVDILWLRVLMELRALGLPLDKIKCSYEAIKKDIEIFEFGILSCIMRKSINLIVFLDGHAQIVSGNMILLNESVSYFTETSYLVINLNRCLAKVFPDKDFSPRLDSFELSTNETLALAQLRLGNYDEIIIKMKNGDIERINTNNIHKGNEIGILADILNKVENGTIRIVKSKNKIDFVEEAHTNKMEELL